MNSELLLRNKKARVTIYNYRPPLAAEANDGAEISEEDTYDEQSKAEEADNTTREAKAKLHESNYEHYSTSSMLQSWAKSKSIRACNVKLSQRLKRRLEKLAHICDLSVVYLNQEAAQL